MRPIKRCVNRQILDICHKAMKLETLNEMVQTWLPMNLKDTCRVGSFERGCLILVTENAAWATQLRFFQFELRDTLRKEAGLYQLGSIEIKIFQK